MRKRNLHRIIRDLMVVAAALPIIILGIYAYVSQTNVYSKEVATSAKDSLLTIQAVVDGFDTMNRSMIKAFSVQPEIRSVADGELDGEAVAEGIELFSKQYPQLQELSLVLRDGSICTKKGLSTDLAYDARVFPTYQKAVANPNSVNLTTISINSAGIKYHNLSYSMAVKSPGTEEVMGVLVADVRFDKLEMILSGIHLRLDGTILVTDDGGNILFGQYTPLGDHLVRTPEEVKAMVSISEHGAVAEVAGEECQVYRGRSLQTGWYIIGIVPVEGLRDMQKSTLILVVVMLLMMLLAVSWLSMKIEGIVTNPIDHLVENIGKFGLAENLERIELARHAPSEFVIIKDTLNNMVERIRDQGEELIQALSNAIEANDEYTKGHCERVKKLSVDIGERIGMSRDELNDLSLAAMLHDVGKVGVPSQILNKPSRLTEEEYTIMKNHSRIGARIVSDISFLSKASEIILQHHERFDGMGYPMGLKGEEIHLMARILCISDSFDAMTTRRSYRMTPLELEAAKRELIDGKGKQFDPDLVDVFIKILEE